VLCEWNEKGVRGGLYRGSTISFSCRMDGSANWRRSLAERCNARELAPDGWGDRGLGASVATSVLMENQRPARHGHAIRSHVQQEDIKDRSGRAANFWMQR
jgi:hypothetical protein